MNRITNPASPQMAFHVGDHRENAYDSQARSKNA